MTKQEILSMSAEEYHELKDRSIFGDYDYDMYLLYKSEPTGKEEAWLEYESYQRFIYSKWLGYSYRSYSNEDIFKDIEYELSYYRSEIEPYWEEEYSIFLEEEKRLDMKRNEQVDEISDDTLVKSISWVRKKDKHHKDHNNTYTCSKYQLLGFKVIHSGEFKHLKQELVPVSRQSMLDLYDDERGVLL